MLWIKAFHVIAIICWMAGLLYLPRLFVYHTAEKINSDTSNLFKIMERRLFKYIMNPAMVISWITGLWLAIEVFNMKGGWLHIKLLLVLILTIHHIFQGKWLYEFSRDERKHNQLFFRLNNEIPTILMIIVVIFVIIKPL